MSVTFILFIFFDISNKIIYYNLLYKYINKDPKLYYTKK
jgi:hypothetical protein